MQKLIGLSMIVGGVALSVWLALIVMLYGGIMSAIENWGTNNSAVVWGIIRAVLCEFGVLPGYVLIFAGIFIWGRAR